MTPISHMKKLDKWYLEFDGINDYLEARNVSDLNLAFPIMAKFRALNTNEIFALFDKRGTVFNEGSWMVSNSGSYKFGLAHRSGSTKDLRDISLTSSIVTYEIKEEGSDLVQYIDGVEVSRYTKGAITMTNSYLFRIGTSATSSYVNFEGDLYLYQIGSEIFPIDEGSGTTITGSEGTVLDIYGATWVKV